MYQASKDYERLWELLKAGKTIIYRKGAANGSNEAGRWAQMTASFTGRGYMTVHGVSSRRFNAHCQMLNVEFIDPASQQSQNLWHGPEERPETDDPIFVVYVKGDFAIDSYIDPHYVAEDHIGSWKAESELIKRWAYVDELINETGGDK